MNHFVALKLYDPNTRAAVTDYYEVPDHVYREIEMILEKRRDVITRVGRLRFEHAY